MTISFLPPAAKIIESLLFGILYIVSALHQHGFTPGKSTTSVLLRLPQDIADGFKQQTTLRCTVIMVLDQPKAFDLIHVIKLTHLILNIGMPKFGKKWLFSYLRRRNGQTNFRDVLSTFAIIWSGVPQGSALAPTLFNLHSSDFPANDPHTNLISYLDGVTIWALETFINTFTLNLQEALPNFENFL